MRKIKIIEHISLDGVIEHAGDYEYGAWTVPYRTPVGMQAVMEAQGNEFDLLLGRHTYDVWSNFWPTAGDTPIANNINRATKYVATHRADSLGWAPCQDLGTDIVGSIRNLKSTNGPDLVVSGSSTITSLLFEEGLVDEVILIVYPVLLGRGKRLFADTVDARELKFINTKSTPTGVMLNRYEYVGSLKS